MKSPAQAGFHGSDEGSGTEWMFDAVKAADGMKWSFLRSRSSYKERKGNALASGADEGRDKLR